MALSTRLYVNMSKRHNSTKQPSTESYTDTSAVLKEGESFTAPVLLVNLKASDTKRLSYNYVRVTPGSGDLTYWYYFINDIVAVGTDLFELHCELDTLATFKADIGSLSKYVIRSGNISYRDGDLIDGMYPLKADITTTANFGTNPWSLLGSTLVLGIVGSGTTGSTSGAINYYALTGEQVRDFFQYLMGTPQDFSGTTFTGTAFIDNLLAVWSQMEEIVDLWLMNPMDSIVCAKWYPFTIDGTAVPTINVNRFITSYHATLLDSTPSKKISGTAIVIPKHPQAVTRGTFLYAAPYSEYELYIEPFGRFTLDGAEICKYTYINYDIYVDIATGEACLEVYAANTSTGRDRMLLRTWGEIGCDIPLSASHVNVGGAALSVAAGIASAASGSTLGAAGSVKSAVEYITPRPTIKSSLKGAITAYSQASAAPDLILHYRQIPGDDSGEIGYPCCQTVTLSAAGPYIQCEDGEHNIATLGSAKQTISDYLVNGFYYE